MMVAADLLLGAAQLVRLSATRAVRDKLRSCFFMDSVGVLFSIEASESTLIIEKIRTFDSQVNHSLNVLSYFL